MSDRQSILIVDDDPMITEALSLAMERPGRTTILCSDLQAAEMMLGHYPVTHLVMHVQFSGSFAFEGLHFIGRVRALAPKCRIVLITGYVTDALRDTAIGLGAATVLSKPFNTEELEHALGTEEPMTESGAYEVVAFPSIEEILSGDELITVFQPILHITADGVAPFAYEALTRVRGDWLAGGPEMLFEYAERRQQLAALNILTVGRAIETAAQLPGTPLLFVNVDPLAFSSPNLIFTLQRASQRSSVALSRVVLEVTERSAIANHEVGTVFDDLRELGLRFALDDHASSYSHLNVIDRIRPSFMKISNSFGTDFEKDTTRSCIISHIVTLAHDLGCETILEGIEGQSTASAAAATGVDLVQGYYFGRPQSAQYWCESPSRRNAA